MTNELKKVLCNIETALNCEIAVEGNAQIKFKFQHTVSPRNLRILKDNLLLKIYVENSDEYFSSEGKEVHFFVENYENFLTLCDAFEKIGGVIIYEATIKSNEISFEYTVESPKYLFNYDDLLLIKRSITPGASDTKGIHVCGSSDHKTNVKTYTLRVDTDK